MRTYTLESVEKKIANFKAFIRRAEKKEAELVKLVAIREKLLSPENLEKQETRLERMQREIARLEASVAAGKALQEERANTENGENPENDDSAES